VIRVALVIGRLNVGGAEAELVRLANRLDRARFDPFVVTLQDPGPLADRLRGVELVALGRRRKWSFGTYGSLKRLLRDRRPDVVQSLLFTENIFCRWIGQGIVVTGLRGSLSDGCETGPSFKLALERSTFDRAAAVVSNSEYYRSLYARLGFDASKIVVIPTSVEPTPETPPETRAGVRQALAIGPDRIMVLCPARLVERKGHEDLIRAGTGFALVFAGEGPFRRSLEGRGATLLGERRDVPALMAASDVVALASRFGEGCPNAVLEAMVAGRPVVAARAGGTPEAVVDGETGILFAPGDVSALRRALERLAADPGLRERLGRAGRERAAREHPVEKMVKRYEALYFKLTEGRASL
jgi:glycosyltransferase involved in cell wall biosynthesis